MPTTTFTNLINREEIFSIIAEKVGFDTTLLNTPMFSELFLGDAILICSPSQKILSAIDKFLFDNSIVAEKEDNMLRVKL